MIESETNDDSPTDIAFRGQAIRDSGKTLKVRPLVSRVLPPMVGQAPEAIRISPVFVEAMKSNLCPFCDFVYPDWESPPVSAERTVHFNWVQTAMLNTAAIAVARIFNNDEYRQRPGMALAEIVRAFLLTEPAQTAMKTHRRAARTERGLLKTADWADVQPALQPEQPAEDASAEMYGETEGDSGDMYGDMGEDTHE
jgi:hypothetical protein